MNENYDLLIKQIEYLREQHPQVAELYYQEIQRQESTINLIASENLAPLDVLFAVGSVFGNKYTEGYPLGYKNNTTGRYYGGCELYDNNEIRCIELALDMFGEHAVNANVQPHSGTQANQAAIMSLLNQGQKIINMGIYSHLSHGSNVNLCGTLFESIGFEEYNNGWIDYDALQELCARERPKLIIGGASSYPRRFNWERLRSIADSVGAYLMADIAHYAGLIVAGLYPNPFPYAHIVTSTTHKTLKGPRGGLIAWGQELEDLFNSRNSRTDDAMVSNPNRGVFPFNQGGPLQNNILAKTVAFESALTDEFKIYQRNVLNNSKIMASELQRKGYKLVTGGTDSHIVLVDLRQTTEMDGLEVQELLERGGIIVNKESVPSDPSSPVRPNGIRLGTPSITARGMGQEQVKYIVELINQGITRELSTEQLSSKVINLCKHFPYYFNEENAYE